MYYMHYMEAAMRTVTAREANQSFSKLLRDVAAGEEVVITLRGKPVARLEPVGQPIESPEREAVIRRMVERMRRGIPLGGRPFTRDEMHER